VADEVRRTAAWFNDVATRADDGDRHALKTALEAHAAVPSLWPRSASSAPTRRKPCSTPSSTADRQLLTRATVERQLETMRDDLLGRPAERARAHPGRPDRPLLAGVQQADHDLASRTERRSPWSTAISPAPGGTGDQRLLRATRALATVDAS
jgi:hypothetical protein